MTYQSNATQDLKQDHLTLKRIRDIAQRCSEKLYVNESIPLEDLEIISVKDNNVIVDLETKEDPEGPLPCLS